MALFGGALMAQQAIAQEKAQERITPAAEKQLSEAELAALQTKLKEATERQRRLATEIDGLDKDLGTINRALIVTANRARELEQGIATQEDRLRQLSSTRNSLRKSLISKRALLSEVLAALQWMGRNPPPAILVRPEDALISVRSAILLGAVVPEVRSETETLMTEMRALGEVSQQIKAKKQELAASLNTLAEDQTRLSLLMLEKNDSANQSKSALLSEQKKSANLARKAKSLEDLINQIETQIASATRAANAAKEADNRRQKEEQDRLAKAREAIAQGEIPKTDGLKELKASIDPQLGNNARTEPAIAFTKAKGLLPLPVSGEIVREFGGRSKSRSPSRNLAISTRPNSRVQSPSDGWVVYAGPFRSYGQLLILNAGDGHHIVLSGMSDVNVTPGQFVLAGEPVGRMGLVQVAAASSLDLSSAKPVLYVEFRKNGRSIDPSPWWSGKLKKRRDNDS